MTAVSRPTFIFMALLSLLLVVGCTPPAEPPVAEEPSSQEPVEPAGTGLLGELQEAGYQDWRPAPGYEELQPAEGPHGDEVQTLLNPTAEQALAEGGSEWPVGTVIAKDIYRDGALIQIAAMKRVEEGWYWGEWNADGEPVIDEGLKAEPCESCHADGTDGTLGVTLEPR